MTEAAQSLARALRDLNVDWGPHEHQKPVLNALFLHLYTLVFLECGRKYGKTELILYFLWRLALTKPGGYYHFFPEQKQAKEVAWATGRLQQFGPKDYITAVNNTDLRVTLRNGSFIKLDGSDNFDSYRGVEPHGAVYDEFRDFRPEFHQAMGPNFSVYEAPLLVCTTPPEQTELEHYDQMKVGLELDKDLFSYPSWANPHISKDWLRKEKAKLYLRGEGDVWEREFGARRVRGGSKSIFPMFSRAMIRPHAEVIEEIRKDRRKLLWQVICDPGNATVFCVLFRAINPYTRRVYRLDELYITSQAETSTSRVVPRIREKRAELYPDAEAHGNEWEQLYDEAATWFATEAMNSFEEHFTATSKGTRDIDQGLSLLKDQMLHGLTVVSDRCINYVREIENYLKDPKTGKPKRDCADHAIDCIAFHEMVETRRGPVPIMGVKIYDQVLTRSGWRDVLDAWYVGDRPVIRLYFSDGRTLECTEEHRVFTWNRGFVPASQLLPADILCSDSYGSEQWPRVKQPSFGERPTAAIRRQSGEATGYISKIIADTCTSTFGWRITAKFLPVIMSITRTATRSITLSVILMPFRPQRITATIIWASALRQWQRISLASAQWLQLGTEAMRARLGIPSMAANASKPGLCLIKSASAAVPPIRPSWQRVGSAPTHASPPSAERRELTTSPSYVQSVRQDSQQISSLAQSSAPSLVRIEVLGRAIAVYDLTVAGSQEFFVNGILVHNCDRYGNDYAGVDLTPEMEPEPIDRDDLPRFSRIQDDLAEGRLAQGEILDIDDEDF